MQPVRISGLVLRETPFGESDKMMTVLTAERGRISVFGRGARRLKSDFFVATQLFCYTEFVLVQSSEKYYIRECSLIESFYNVRATLQGLALASYIADVAADAATEEHEHAELLRLTLNCFWAICDGKKPLKQIKAVFELRIAAYAGFMPDLVGCAGCGNYNFPVYYIDIPDGTFRCEECFRKNAANMEQYAARENEAEGIYCDAHLIVPASPDVFIAMRYAVYSKPERIFAFELAPDALEDFASVCEKYLLCHMERGFKTLDFYHSVEEK